MENVKTFDPADIDETLTRVVTHGRATYLMFPYINGVDPVPRFDSISRVITGSAATVEDFSALSALVRQAAKRAEWFLSFNTPWLVAPSEAQSIRQRAPVPRGNRR
jgi:hypothetical protein